MAHSQVLGELGVLKIDLILRELVLLDKEGYKVVYLLWYPGAVDSDVLEEVHECLVALDLLGIESDLVKGKSAGLASIELLFILADLEVEDEF